MNSPIARFEIDNIDFEVPCRRFTIRATITRDRQLPVVDEFLLRMLAVLERVPIRRLRGWFGFTEAEIETVLLDLERRAYVEVDRDDILLAPAGRDLFRAAPDGGVPRLVEVAPLIDHIWFDLVSRNMVPRSRARSVDYLVRLREQPSARDLPERFAREAFEANFRDYARRVKRLPDADAVNIYAVSDVEAGTYAYQSVPAVVELDPLRVALRCHFPVLEEDPVRFRALTMLAIETWEALSSPDGADAAIVEYERLTGGPLLAPFVPGAKDADHLRGILTTSPVLPFARTIGATYLEHNAAKLINAAAARAIHSSGSVEILWLRPAVNSWARTHRIANTILKLRDALRNANASAVRTSLIMSRTTPKQIRKLHRRLFDRGLLLPQGHMPANIEILLVKGAAALVNVQLRISGHAVPVGGLVTNEKLLTRIADRLSEDPGWEELWARDSAPHSPRPESRGVTVAPGQ